MPTRHRILPNPLIFPVPAVCSSDHLRKRRNLIYILSPKNELNEKTGILWIFEDRVFSSHSLTGVNVSKHYKYSNFRSQPLLIATSFITPHISIQTFETEAARAVIPTENLWLEMGCAGAGAISGSSTIAVNRHFLYSSHPVSWYVTTQWDDRCLRCPPRSNKNYYITKT